MKKLVLIEASVNYDGCYYEGDEPSTTCDFREVTIQEAIKAIMEEGETTWYQIINSILPPEKSRGKVDRFKQKHAIEVALKQCGYFHKTVIDKSKLNALLSTCQIISHDKYQWRVQTEDQIENFTVQDWVNLFNNPHSYLVQSIDIDSITGEAKKRITAAKEKIKEKIKENVKAEEKKKKREANKKGNFNEG